MNDDATTITYGDPRRRAVLDEMSFSPYPKPADYLVSCGRGETITRVLGWPKEWMLTTAEGLVREGVLEETTCGGERCFTRRVR